VTDQQIKTVYLGNEHRKVKPDDKEAYNSVSDLIGADFDLVIVKLGYLGYKNKAAPGALKEALLVRKDLSLPTWVIEDPQYPWTHSRDFDVEQFLDERYDTVVIDGSERTPEPDDMGTDPDPEEGVIALPKPRKAAPKPPRPQVSYTDLNLDDLELPGESKKKKGNW
jgi:hypothetical protein